MDNCFLMLLGLCTAMSFLRCFLSIKLPAPLSLFRVQQKCHLFSETSLNIIFTPELALAVSSVTWYMTLTWLFLVYTYLHYIQLFQSLLKPPLLPTCLGNRKLDTQKLPGGSVNWQESHCLGFPVR